MGIHQLKRVITIPVSVKEAWDFFSSPANLERITPPHLNLRITNGVADGAIYPGQIITYRVKPLLGIPVLWVTEITHVREGVMFVDEQRKGPYKMWHHEHHFRPAPGGGTEMTDIVHYEVPFGPLGAIAHPLIVKGELEKIFKYRTKRVEEIFGRSPQPTVDSQR